jgi:hypothetical protein
MEAVREAASMLARKEQALRLETEQARLELARLIRRARSRGATLATVGGWLGVSRQRVHALAQLAASEPHTSSLDGWRMKEEEK